MASLRLTFPEKDEPTVIALTGARLTIGRLPFNTIQIIDRTVSGFHAELISEHGHYRLHDRGSSNGTFVNGQKVADFHLSEACTITFGTVEAQFSPEAVSANEEAESFPTRNEINSVRKENVELRATVEALREETHALRLVRPMESGDKAMAVPKEEFDKVVVERETLKEERLKQDEEISRLKTDLAVLKRDRVNLQLAYDGLQREITDVRAKAGGVEEIALPPKAAAAALASQVSDPGKEVRVDVPISELITGKTALIPSPIARPAPEAAPAEEKASEAPASPPAPAVPPAAPSYPRAPASAPKSAPSTTMKPFAPLPKPSAIAVSATAKPIGVTFPAPAPASKPPENPAPAASDSDKPSVPKAPIGLGTGIRPLGKPPGAVPAPAENGAAGLPHPSAPRVAPRPMPTVKLPAQPAVKHPATPEAAPTVGPKGTQKLS
jgi:pSer/pThr/pTyr-binding forkhead associated (FHA) protein